MRISKAGIAIASAILAGAALVSWIAYGSIGSAKREAAFRTSLRAGMRREAVLERARSSGGYDAIVMAPSSPVRFLRFPEGPSLPCTSHGTEFELHFDPQGRLDSWNERPFESAC